MSGGGGGAEDGLSAVAEEGTRKEWGLEFWLMMVVGFHGGCWRS